MEIKRKDVEKNINENIPIETDYFIADLILDSDGININLLIKINETKKTHYIKSFDLNKVTEASRIINKIMDTNNNLPEDIDELDIYSKEKGVDENE